MQDDTREALRDQVTRLMSFLRDVVRSRSGDVRDIDEHVGHVWVGSSTSVSVRSSAVPGNVVIELGPDDPAHSELSGLLDELAENPETLELVLANALVTVHDDAGGYTTSEPLVREHPLTQALVADRDDSRAIRLSLAAGSVPVLHDTHLLASVDGIELAGAVKTRSRIAEQPSVASKQVADLIGDWLDEIDVDPDRVRLALDMRPAVVLRRRSVEGSVAFYDAILDDLRDDESPVPVGPAQLVRPIEAPERLAALAEPGILEPARLVSDALFPLPSNVEQRDALVRLGNDIGVVVEGPPGTGKTHTIANVMSALLAKGQRVLVVSEKAHALHVLRDMLPPELRDLAVSIADVSRDRSDAIVSVVENLATRKASFSEAVADAEIADLEARREHALMSRDRTGTCGSCGHPRPRSTSGWPATTAAPRPRPCVRSNAMRRSTIGCRRDSPVPCRRWTPRSSPGSSNCSRSPAATPIASVSASPTCPSTYRNRPRWTRSAHASPRGPTARARPVPSLCCPCSTASTADGSSRSSRPVSNWPRPRPR